MLEEPHTRLDIAGAKQSNRVTISLVQMVGVGWKMKMVNGKFVWVSFRKPTRYAGSCLNVDAQRAVEKTVNVRSLILPVPHCVVVVARANNRGHMMRYEHTDCS